MTYDAIQAVLLDMGGVILEMVGNRGFPDTRVDWRGRQALLERIAKAGGRTDMDELERLVFGPWRQAYERREVTAREVSWTPYLDVLRRASGCELPDIELLQAWFRPYGEQLRPIAGAGAALEELAGKGYRMALVSNVPLPGALYREVLETHRLVERFEATLFSYDIGSRKPLPTMLKRAMTDMGVAPAASVMVGDRRERDIAAGRLAGIRTVWIRSSDAGGPEADAEIESLAGLPPLLESWRR